MTRISKHHLFLAASIVLSSVAQLSMKAGVTLLPAINIGLIGHILSDPSSILWVLLGLCCYGISMLCWMSALTRFDLSFAYPMLSLSYVLVYIAAIYWPLLNEPLSVGRCLGIVVVVIGVLLVTQTDVSKIESDPTVSNTL